MGEPFRVFIRHFDGLLRRPNGLFPFDDRPDCVLLLEARRAPRTLLLADGTEVYKGDPVLMIHTWNEHIPPMGPMGPDLAWAAQMRRALLHSLRAMAQWLACQPQRVEVRAIRGTTVLVGLE